MPLLNSLRADPPGSHRSTHSLATRLSTLAVPKLQGQTSASHRWCDCASTTPRLLDFRTRAIHRFPLGNASCKLGVALIPDKGPGLFVGQFSVGMRGTILDQAFGIVQIAIDGLNGGGHTIFLSWLASCNFLARSRAIDVRFGSALPALWP